MLALKHWQTDHCRTAWGLGRGMPLILGHAGSPGALSTRGMSAVGSRAQSSGCLCDSATLLTEIFHQQHLCYISSQSKQGWCLLPTKQMKDSSLAEYACPDTHSAVTAASKTSRANTSMQGALSSVTQPTRSTQICSGGTASPGAKKRVQHRLQKLSWNRVAKCSSPPDTL